MNCVDPSGLVTSYMIGITRSGTSSTCHVYLRWSGPDIYSMFAFDLLSVKSTSLLYSKTYDTIGSIRKSVAPSTYGHLFLRAVTVPSSVNRVRTSVIGLRGYNLRTSRWEYSIANLNFNVWLN